MNRLTGLCKKVIIYICDDEQFWIEIAHDTAENLLKGKVETEFKFFDKTNSLIDKTIIKKECPDIIILDINMPFVDGFEIAKQIKETYPDIILMFFTNHEQYVFDSFQFQPFRFIRKINAQRELELALMAAIQVLEKRSLKSVILRTNNKTVIVDIKKIMYFEKDGKKAGLVSQTAAAYLLEKE